MECHILCVGPYTYGVSDCLDYPAKMYTNVFPGVHVTSSLASVDGLKSSKKLAEAVGANLEDPGSWSLTPSMINITKLIALSEISLEEIESLQRLIDNGFKFFLMPDM